MNCKVRDGGGVRPAATASWPACLQPGEEGPVFEAPPELASCPEAASVAGAAEAALRAHWRAFGRCESDWAAFAAIAAWFFFCARRQSC